MKPLRHLVLVLFLLFAFVLPGSSCGPFFPEAVFVSHTRPDGAYADFAKGRIGVPQPGYRVRHLVVAYDWLSGHGLSVSEQQQAIALDLELNPPDDAPLKTETGVGLAAWAKARQSSGVPDGMQGTPSQPKQPEGEEPRIESMVLDRLVPGDDYQTFGNCLDNAFATAAHTLDARKAAHANDPAAVADWVHGQDAVFSNCGDTGNTLPSSTAASAPAWLRQDRAYQLASAKFYQTDYTGAIAQLRVVAADPTSPWHDTARFVIARALIRLATVGQITEVPAAARAPRDATNNPQRADLLTAYNHTLEQKRAGRMAEARDALRAIQSDPSMQPFHASASGLLDFVMLRLDPATQEQTIARRLTGPNRPQQPGLFRQSLIDLHYLTNPPDDNSHPKPDATNRSAHVDLLAWLTSMTGADREPPSDSNLITYDEIKAQHATNNEAAQTALARWQNTHATQWLIAALTAIQVGNSAAPELVHAATALPQDSSAWTAATYHRLRLTSATPATRAELDTLLPSLAHDQSRSTINLFTILRQRNSPTLAAFLQDAGTLPAGTLLFDDPDPPSTKPNPDGLCGANFSEAETRLFDHDAATILNTRMPLSLLADAAVDQMLQRNLRFQVAQATWARAVLLQQPGIAKRMTPILTGCYAAWKPWLDKYDNAAGPDDRHAAGLLALMRFASTDPIVQDGEQRSEGFATYSEFRDNWWQESSAGGPPTNADGTKSTTGTVPPTFFGTKPATRAEIPDPPFLSTADRAQAGREVAALRTIPCASDYFAQAALTWQKQHPTDSRTPDILGFAERVVRNGCRTDATKELNHQLFVVVQAKYPNSEWAKKYTSWE